MGERKRMISAQIIESDSFLSMSLSAQCLYLHYCVNGDDDGFVQNPMTTFRVLNAGEEDFEELKNKGFIISFEKWIIVITHWHIHNVIPKIRYKPTEYTEQRAQLYNKPNGQYTLNRKDGKPYQQYLEGEWTKKRKNPKSKTDVEQVSNECQTDADVTEQTERNEFNELKKTESGISNTTKEKIKSWGGMTRDTDLEELQKKIFVN